VAATPSLYPFVTCLWANLAANICFPDQGLLVYANQGSEEDFKELETQGINLEGTIALTRYGGVGRGAKVSSIHQAGIWVKGQQWTGHQEEGDREEAAGVERGGALVSPDTTGASRRGKNRGS
jgi:hypothetical protein